MHTLIERIFGNGGLLSHHLPGYEERLEQKAMAAQIVEAYHEKQIALIEAGTGIGKSLAYLVPAILWAIKNDERSVIATNTIALQEQLIEKDIPFLLKVLDVELKASLVKGMGNYLCLQKYAGLEAFHPEMEQWLMQTGDGSRSDINFPLPPDLWEQVAAEPDRCIGAKCSHYKPCFFFKARRTIHDAKILVVNHHLLLADLVADKEQAILPDFERLIIDEAHNLEEIALESLSRRVDRSLLLKLLTQKLEIPSDYPDSLRVSLEIDLPAQRQMLALKVVEAFRLLPEETSRVHGSFSPEIQEAFKDLEKELFRFAAVLYGLMAKLEKYPKMDYFALDLHGMAKKFEEMAEVLEIFFEEQKKDSRLRWIEKTVTNHVLREADLDISTQLKELIFERFATTSLCSATLTANREFKFIRQRLGIQPSEMSVTEKIYDSPFDYQNRVLLVIPKDVPDPTEFSFLRVASEMVLKAVRASGGNAFVLFTSYEMLNQCYELLKEEFAILRQGDASRTTLLDKFKATEGSVLFGTDSFWEGVDVPGDALRLVIIMKLPFKVPDDPIVAAKGDLLKKAGKNPFMEYLLPEATIKFKQGFGRLMRRKTDRGCVLCLDKRVMTKSYGALLLKSLPPAPVYWEESSQIYARMKALYARLPAK